MGLHLKNVYSEGELDEKSTTELFSAVQKEGKRMVTRQVKFYNLDAIISVGYRVKSKCGKQLAEEIFVAYAQPGGNVVRLIMKWLKKGKKVLAFDIPENHTLIKAGALGIKKSGMAIST